ncbi:GNAT family N-acetyltransferase [Bacillus solimangrovi]|uniref:GNAT family N-acetyltransferase n=1 Tax=Bacillus solimangrovi TaxID=1305675 RepID=A0A1E5LHS0_9BACI|nr:GNAT family N-acetyltransferase [Bacillus solimangrovi]OEH93634.1 GNAT family N-acetyltransferase [Bacillus solimangrovi]
MSNSLTIRTYENTDFLAIKNYDLPEKQAIYTSLPLDVVSELQNDQHKQPYVIQLGNDLIGFFALYTDEASNIYTSNKHAILFKSFSIDSRYQNKGYAFNALNLLPKIIKKNFSQKNEIILTFHHTNTPAKNLYTKAGFSDKGLRFNGEYGEELIFHFDLTLVN